MRLGLADVEPLQRLAKRYGLVTVTRERINGLIALLQASSPGTGGALSVIDAHATA